MEQVAIVIPFYKSSLTAYEIIALQQCKAILNNYPIIAIKPQSLNLPQEAGIIAYKNIFSFDNKFFTGIAGYNKLMLSADFYAQFCDYKYILIYQLDAFVFKDELTYWCQQGFDYIGAPWMRKTGNDSFLKKIVLRVQKTLSTAFNLKRRGVPNKYQFENKVGNGGFSLRRVSVFHELCLKMKPQIDFYLSKTEHQYNEDAFWSLEVRRNKYQIAIPNANIALKFAIENNPENAYKLNGAQFPFGCHDWDSYIDFWKPIFLKCGYHI